MKSLQFEIRDFVDGDVPPTDVVRSDLKTNGVSVVRLYREADMQRFEESMDLLAVHLRPDGGTASGSRGMGGLVRRYGAASDPNIVPIRLCDRARKVFASVYGLEPPDVFTGWDAVGILGCDAVRKPLTEAALHHHDPEKAYQAMTGGSLQPHVDIGVNSPGSKAEAKMKDVHPVFARCIQGQFVCKSVQTGSATLVVAPGPFYDAEVDTSLFHTEKGNDFCICTQKGYAHYRNEWRAVDGVPRGCLILWLSCVPHGNKLADHGVDPRRRIVFISWQARALVTDEEREILKNRKLFAIRTGATTDHWATNADRLHRGSHYSNGKKLTQVVYSEDTPPELDEELLRRIEEAF